MPSRHRWLIALLLPLPLAAQSERELLEEAFRRLDPDKDGVIVRLEFPGSDRQFAAMDQDGNGKVTFAEYAASPVGKAFLRARAREQQEPRPRTTADLLALQRLELLSRVDRNRDGKVTREEWNGTEAAFRQLDLDGNGVLDRRDRTEAAGLAPTARVMPEPTGELPPPEQLLRRYDKDKDGRLLPKELGDHKYLQSVFAFADTDGDGALSQRELEALAALLAERRAERERNGRRREPYAVPFDAWDKDRDGRIQQNEWQGPRALFERIDLDRDAAITREELRRYELRASAEDFIQAHDLNGDGRVTLAEFGGPLAVFQRADRNGDGVVSRADRP